MDEHARAREVVGRVTVLEARVEFKGDALRLRERR